MKGFDDHLDNYGNPGLVNEPEPVTTVVFRKWRESEGGGIIALFPQVSEGRGLVESYEHVGQHGAASYMGVLSLTRPATPDEYAALKRELESAPFNYNLKICKRRPH